MPLSNLLGPSNTRYSGMSSRNWVFTYNNPITDEIFRSTTQIKTCVATLEIGKQGTEHYQGYLELKTSRDFSTVRKIFTGQPHIEQRRGTREQALSYVCKTWEETEKNSTEPIEPSNSTDKGWLDSTEDEIPFFTLKRIIAIGWTSLASIYAATQSKQSKDERLSEIQSLIQSQATMKHIADNYFNEFLKYGNQIQKYILMNSIPRNTKTRITVIYGPTGTGKSHYANNLYPEAYWKPRGIWWDGYNNEEAVIMDEFYGWIEYDTLLRLGDQYKMMVQNKGGYLNFNSKHIIITTNSAPKTWYKNITYFDAFIRRVEEWIIMPTRDKYTVTPDYNDNLFN